MDQLHAPTLTGGGVFLAGAESCGHHTAGAIMLAADRTFPNAA